jgi:hypothetical protein
MRTCDELGSDCVGIAYRTLEDYKCQLAIPNGSELEDHLPNNGFQEVMPYERSDDKGYSSNGQGRVAHGSGEVNSTCYAKPSPHDWKKFQGSCKSSEDEDYAGFLYLNVDQFDCKKMCAAEKQCVGIVVQNSSSKCALYMNDGQSPQFSGKI